MTDTAPPILCIYENGAFRPAREAMQLRAARFYREGAEYELVEHHARSSRSHSHYFACVEEAFRNLPEVYAQEFSSADQLRKWALIRTGFHDRDELVCDTPEDAQKISAFAKRGSDYVVVQVSGNVVRRFTAKSQNMRSMDKDEFQRSKTAVLDLLSSIVGVSRDQLETNAGKAA